MEYVLYISRDKRDPSILCPGSRECMAIVNRLDEGYVNVQDVDVMRTKTTLPAWLNGTPILVEKTNPIPMRGTDAVNHLHLLSRTPVDETPSLEGDFDIREATLDSGKNTISQHDIDSFLGKRR